MVVVKQFSSLQFNTLDQIAGRILYDSTIKGLRYNDSLDYSNILVSKDLFNNVSEINNLTIDGNLNITNHNRSINTGLTLNGVLVTATAAELNYTQVTPGLGTASKALVLDSDRDIENINIISANQIITTYLNTNGNVGINTTARDFGLEVNHSSGNCLRLTFNDNNGSPTYKCDFQVASNGNLTITPTGNNPTILMPANLSGKSLSLTKQNIANNTVDLILNLTALPDSVSASGLGAGIEFAALNSTYTIFTLGTFEGYSTNIIDSNENGAYRWRLANNGVLNTVATLSSLGLFDCNSITTELITAGQVTETSDIRLKTNIETINNLESKNTILQLIPKKYNFKNNLNREKYGFIAQEVKKVIPSIIEITETEEISDLHHIHYTGLIPHLVNCIKDLYAELNNIKVKLNS
jgi:hypothetical protein